MDSRDVNRLMSVLVELDKLKGVLRQTYVLAGQRRENSAEHSWHTATTLIMLIELTEMEIDRSRLLEMALVHDICEIDHGDTSIYARDQAGKHKQESACMDRICALHPDLLSRFRDLWEEYEEQATPESRLLKVADRILPFLLNIASEGLSWREDGIKKSQVIAVHQPVKRVMPELFSWMEIQIDQAVAKGWLLNA